jgi:hypothetical protein
VPPEPTGTGATTRAATGADGAPGRTPFQYAVVRVVPRVERGERVNVGVVLLCRPRRFLGARFALGERQLAALEALDPGLDLDALRAHLDALERIAAGSEGAGPIAALSQAERFHWLVAPSSTIIEAADQHTGLTEDPAATLDRLFATLVA